jgi:hypothetical protein
MRRSPPTLFNPMKVPGALVPGMRLHFGKVVQEPVPAHLAALLHQFEAKSDASLKEEADHGPSAANSTNSVDRRG